MAKVLLINSNRFRHPWPVIPFGLCYVATALETNGNMVIKYHKGTGENIPYESNSFDIVLCCDVLEHVRDLPKVISEISRVLKN
jgi:ubiquinone/menaquinone biosynthesis C-methylase UbiE